MSECPSLVVKVPVGTSLEAVREISEVMGPLKEKYNVSITTDLGEKEGKSYCWYCGGQLVWQSDYNFDEVYASEDGNDEGIVTYLHCSNCGANVEYSHRDADDDYGDDDE